MMTPSAATKTRCSQINKYLKKKILEGGFDVWLALKKKKRFLKKKWTIPILQQDLDV